MDVDLDVAQRNQRLQELGYLPDPQKIAWSSEEIDKAIGLFQTNHGDEFLLEGFGVHKRECTADGQWGPVSQILLDRPRTCGCPDIPRDAEGNIEEARWPDSCADLEWSCNFIDQGAPGLDSDETTHGVILALAQWNTIFSVSPGRGKITEITDTLLQEFARLGGNTSVNQWVLWLGTTTHEIGHAIGLPHTPGDANSVMYPSMRGQYLVNSTDRNNMGSRGYDGNSNVSLKLANWQGTRGTDIWARLKALPGGTLAWSFLPSNTCNQTMEQAYDSTVKWNSRKIDMPSGPTPPPDPGPPTGRIRVVESKIVVELNGKQDSLVVIPEPK